MTPVDLVLIGRNEGARLVAALEAVPDSVRQVVYVDSGSTDDSVRVARSQGATVVELDLATPFTAARARNAGFDALDDPQIVQFIDGDCALLPGWIEAGRAFLETHPEHGLVTGWRTEAQPGASPYNLLCEWEWHRPAGPIRACGGDMMVRATAWFALGGMNPNVIAAEDDEFCTRLRKAGWRLERLPQLMTRHDAAMTRFGQWWRRAVRTGHGFAQVGHLHPEYFVTERRRVWLYGAGVPVLALLGVVLWPLAPLALAAYGYNWHRSAQAIERDGFPRPAARRLGVLVMLSKLPNMIGLATYHLRRLSGRAMHIIEYK